MLNAFLLKIIRLPAVLRMRFSPALNRRLFAARGIRFGRGMQVMGRVAVTGTARVTIGDDFLFTSGEAVNPISSNLEGCCHTEGRGEIVIGNQVGMSSTRMWIKSGLHIGHRVNIGACVLLIDTDCHQMDYRMRRRDAAQHFGQEILAENILSAPITIEDDVWIGAHTLVLKGVTIGARSIIGAGSVVTRSIPPDCIAAGNPCRVIRSLNPTGPVPAQDKA